MTLEQIVADRLRSETERLGRFATHADYATAAIDAIYQARKEPTPEMLEAWQRAAGVSEGRIPGGFMYAWSKVFPLALGRGE